MITDLQDKVNKHHKMSYNISLYQNRNEENSSLKFLMKRVNFINSLLQVQKQNLQNLEKTGKILQNANEYKIEKKLKKKMTQINKEICDLIEKVNKKLKTMRKKVSETKKEKNKNNSDIRHIETIINIFQIKNISNLKKHSKIQLQQKQKSFQKTKNNILIQTQMSEEEVDTMLRNEPEKILSILENGENLQRNNKVDNTLEDMREKLNDIKKVDKGVEKLLKMLKELHLIISDQNEVVDSIEFNMGMVTDDLKTSEDDVVESSKLMVSAQEKIWCIFVVMIFLSIFLVNALLGSFLD